MVVAQLAHDGRQGELLHGGYCGRNGSKCGADAGLLTKHIDAEAAAFGGHVGKIQVIALAQYLELRLGQYFGDVGFEFRVAQIAEFDRHQIPVHAQHRRHAYREVQIRASLGHA